MELSGLLFGTAYYMDELCSQEIREDLSAMRAANITFVRVGDRSWPYWEPRQGEYDLSRLYEVLTLSRKQNIKVLLALPGDFLPEWLKGAEYPAIQKQNDLLIYRLVSVVKDYRDMVAFQVDAHAFGGKLAQHQCSLLRQLLGDNVTVVTFADSSFGKNIGEGSILGCPVYHEAGLKNTGAELTLRGDAARGDRPYLVLETQCQGRLGQLPYPGQLRLWAFHHIASGARGLSYWHWRSETKAGSNWKGVVGYGGSKSRAYQEVSAIGQEFCQLGSHLAGLRKQNRVAILVSPTSARNMPECGGKSYDDILRWICTSFYRLNIEVDLIDDRSRDFSQYALVVTPCLYSAEDDLIMALRNYTAEGGCLISTFRSFFTDSRGEIRRGQQPYGMTDVFGMHYEEFTVPEETCLPEYVAEVSDFMEILEPEEAVSLAIYDSPAWRGRSAATCSRFGKGQAAYFGCYSEEGFEPILLRMLAMWHIPVPETSWPVVQKRAIGPTGKMLTFLLHYSPASRVISSPATGTELFSGKRLDEGEPLELRGWDVKILEGD